MNGMFGIERMAVNGFNPFRVDEICCFLTQGSSFLATLG